MANWPLMSGFAVSLSLLILFCAKVAVAVTREIPAAKKIFFIIFVFIFLKIFENKAISPLLASYRPFAQWAIPVVQTAFGYPRHADQKQMDCKKYGGGTVGSTDLRGKRAGIRFTANGFA
jgi:hypothetical protein